MTKHKVVPAIIDDAELFHELRQEGCALAVAYGESGMHIIFLAMDPVRTRAFQVIDLAFRKNENQTTIAPPT